MLDPQASRFWQAALLSGLMDVEGLTRCWNAIPPSKREAPEHIDRRLARQAVQSRALTLWQAQQLLAGRTSGFQVDRYVLLDLIGQGGMGRVYLARDTRLNRKVALKILAPERMNNPRAVARFHREARVGAQLQHENLVRVYDFGESQGRYFLVMEFIEGRTIGHLISEHGPLPPPTAARLVRQVAVGLSHAHNKGLIHRDVNPDNILVTHDETAKLADLGLAIDLTEEGRVTRDGATVGTFDYVAPEQARHSHAADIRSDIYSLGCTLYHMLSGQVPFPSPSLPEKLFAHQALEATPVETLVPGLPAGLGDVVRTMMRKSPEERYESPMQVAQALEPYLDDRIENSPEGDRTGQSSAASQSRSSSHADESGPPVEVPAPATVATPRMEEEGTPLVAGPEALPVFTAPSVPPVPSLFAQGPVATADASTEASTRSDLDRPIIPLLTPPEDAPGNGDTGPLLIDLGPEPPLSDRLARSRTRSPAVPIPHPLSDPLLDGTDAGPLRSMADDVTKWLPLRLSREIVVLAVLAFALVLAGALLLFWRSPVKPADSTGPRPSQGPDAKAGSPPGARQREPEIVVCIEVPGKKEAPKEIRARDLAGAIQIAMVNLGYVELRNHEPLHVDAGQIPDLSSGTPASVEIRGAKGVAPIIEVHMRAGRPFLATQSTVSLVMSGLEIRVNYPPNGGGAPIVPSPLIEVGGPVTIRRCAFQVVGDAGPSGSRALFVNSNEVIIERCWFEGFDTAIDVQSYARTVAQIRQTMIVPRPNPAERRGWGVRICLAPGGGPPRASRKLELDHCTFEGAGFLELLPEKVESKLDVEVKHCAVRADALLAWKPAKPEVQLVAQFPWKGEGNRFSILGRYWIVGSSSNMGVPAFASNVTDLESWSKVTDGERNPIPNELRYRTDPAARSGSVRPADFAFDSPNPPGADPEQVGPWRP